MRLRRLDLTRYGKFTDRCVEFGPAPAQGPDFHIIYGPNEAGKSTTMQGWLDLLFGIPTQSRMDFLHPYGTMQLGAAIEAGSDVIEVIRTKGRTNTLTDPAGSALPEALLQAALGGIDRAGYEAMFSLDDETLEKGGESILSSQGDLGQMLFTASSGLAEMGQALDALRTRTSAFHKPGGRSGGLADLKKALAEVDQRIADQDTGARDFALLVQARDQAEAAWQAAEAEQATTGARLHLVERQLAALPLVTRLRLVNAALRDLPPLPPLPQGWADELPDLMRDHAQTVVRVDEQQGQLTRLRDELSATIDDPVMLDHVDAMARVEALKSDWDGALRDLPLRRAEAATVQGRLGDLLRRLGAAGRDPATLLPPAPVVAGLRGLMERHSGLIAATGAAAQEVEAAKGRLDGLTAQIGAAGAMAKEVAVLAEVTEAALRSDPVAALLRTQQSERLARDRFDMMLARLAPWRGTGAALAELALPAPSQIAQWRQGEADATRRLEQSSDTAARLNDELAQLSSTAVTSAATGPVTLDMAAQVRSEREALWAAHRSSLTAQSADHFEAALRRDDHVTAQTVQAQAEAQTQARHCAEVTARAEKLKIDSDRAAKEVDAARLTLDDLRAAWRASLPEGFGPGVTLDAFEDWLRKRDTALEAWADWQAAARDVAGAEGQHRISRTALAAALDSAGKPMSDGTPLDVLAAQARVVLDHARGHAALIASRDATAAELAQRRSAQAQAEAAFHEWQTAWRNACAGVALTDDVPDVATMGEALELLRQLELEWADSRKLQDRIDKMQVNQTAFENALAALVARLPMNDMDTAVAAMAGDTAMHWARLVARRDAALRGQDQRRALHAKLESAKSAANATQDRLARLETRLKEMCSHLGCADTTSLQRAVAQAGQRQEQSAERDQLVRDICEGMGTDDLDAALHALEELDRPALAAERDALAATQQRQAQALQQLYADRSTATARIEAVGGDDVVARLQERRQTLLLQIEDEAQTYLRHRLGVAVVDHALQRYRDSHRSAMMQRASDAFGVITRQAYTRLAAQTEGDREVLVAIAANGASKLARDLSKGTRFQLYLALRVAGFHEIAGSRSTIPFIADDILETFDDDRAAETFALLAGMAEVGQVIYLTHHRHLCEIAARVCPRAQRHDLG